MTRVIRTVVVDDEPLAREGLRVRLGREEDIEIVGEADDGPSAVNAVLTLRPDLVFLDVQIPGFDGFDVVSRTASTYLPTIIFVTAYDRYALQAFEVHALDYLLKPFDQARFSEAVARARAHIGAPRDPSLRGVAALLEEVRARQRSIERSMDRTPAAWPQRLVVRDGPELRFVPVADVDWFGAADNYVELHVAGKMHLFRETLSNVERKLDPARFTRIRRDAIVNLERVRAVRPGETGELEVVLSDGTTLRLGRAYRDRMTERWQMRVRSGG